MKHYAVSGFRPQILNVATSVIRFPVPVDAVITRIFVRIETPLVPTGDAEFNIKLGETIIDSPVIDSGESTYESDVLSEDVVENDILSVDVTALPTAGIYELFVMFTLEDGEAGGTTIPFALVVAISDETTSLTTGAAKLTFRWPAGVDISEVRASLTTSSSSGAPAFDVSKNGSTIFTTTLTIDSGEKTSETAATPAVLTSTPLAFASDDEIIIDIDTAGTGANGAKITFIGTYQ